MAFTHTSIFYERTCMTCDNCKGRGLVGYIADGFPAWCTLCGGTGQRSSKQEEAE